MAGPPPYQISAISSHTNPKEKTILLFVTDGADTCAGSGDGAALVAANAAKNLYLPVVNSARTRGDSMASTPPCADANNNGVSGFSEPASSVQTFMIGYGDGVNSVADVNRLNWISWGGSGVNKDFPGQNTGNNTTTDTNLKAFGTSARPAATRSSPPTRPRSARSSRGSSTRERRTATSTRSSR